MTQELPDSLMPFCAAPQRFLLDHAQAHAPLARFRLHDEHFAIVCDPEASYAILNGSDDDFEKGELYDLMRTTLGEGPITTDGEAWRVQHSLLAPLFARRRLRELEPLIADCVVQLLDAWQARSGTEVELMADCKRFAFDVVSRGLLALDDPALADELYANSATVDRLESVRIHYLAKRFRNASVGDGFTRSALVLALERLEELTYAVVDRRLQQHEQVDDMLGAAITSDTVRAMGNDERRRFLRDIVATLLMAGYTTTGETLFWTFYLLARHPDVQQRAFNALPAAPDGTPAPRFDAPPYLGAVFNESLRLYPPVWFMGRITHRPLDVSGETLATGTRLLCSPLILQQLPQLWPDAARFMPERFLPDAPTPPVQRAFIPFGTGMHACVGRGLAMMEKAALVGSALRRFEFTLVTQEPPTITAAFATQPRDPVFFTLRPRA
jgi:cytochrome P450